MTDRPLVSVVTPFHNTAAYLAECIESVLAQTYPAFEHVLLDNRSSDGSTAIAEEYARRDPRIKLHHTDTLLPQDLNYSHALRLISGESRYVKVVQADDWVFPRCLEEMVALAEAHPSIGLVSSYWLKGAELMGQGLPVSQTFMPGRDAARFQLQSEAHLLGSATTVLFRADVVRGTHPFYDPAVPHADTEACYRTLRTTDFGFVHQVLSYLRVAAESRMGSVEAYHPWLMDRFIIIRKYGPDFLAHDEYDAVYSRWRERYFRWLGRVTITQRDPSLWEYHRAGLATVGYDLRRRRLWKYALLALAGILGHPWESAALLRRRLARRPE